jgi:Ubiquitin family
MFLVRVKWNKQEFQIETEPNQEIGVLKTQLFSLTGVLPDRQKLLIKGKLLNNDEKTVQDVSINQETCLMMLGTPTENFRTLPENSKSPEPVKKSPVQSLPHYEPKTPKDYFRPNKTISLPIGLKNSNQSSYLNSAIQIIRTIPVLAQAILKYQTYSPNNPIDQIVINLGVTIQRLNQNKTAFVPSGIINIYNAGFPAKKDPFDCMCNLLNAISPLLLYQGKNISEYLFDAKNGLDERVVYDRSQKFSKLPNYVILKPNNLNSIHKNSRKLENYLDLYENCTEDLQINLDKSRQTDLSLYEKALKTSTNYKTIQDIDNGIDNGEYQLVSFISYKNSNFTAWLQIKDNIWSKCSNDFITHVPFHNLLSLEEDIPYIFLYKKVQLIQI